MTLPSTSDASYVILDAADVFSEWSARAKALGGDRSLFPNWSGIERKSTFNITGDELTFTNPMSSIGAVPDQVVWKRAK
jgi:hypothetical protein